MASYDDKDSTKVINSLAMRYVVDYFRQEHNLELTPAGRWVMGDDGKKKALNAKRVDSLEWENYPEDNMGRLFLRKEILVLDVDGSEVIFDKANREVTLVELGITIPYGLYTTTTQSNKFHFYYKTNTDEIPNRIVGLHNKTIDVFTYGTVFEGHTFAKSHSVYRDSIIAAPYDLLMSIDEWVCDKKLLSSKADKGMGVTSHIHRYNVVVAFLEDTLTTSKQWNGFYKTVIPAEFMPERKSGLKIDKFKLSYDLFNKVAVKLTTTAELGFYEHVVPALHKLLTMWGISPNSEKSKEIMWSNVLPSLPQHEAIHSYTPEEDTQTFQQLLKQQPDTATPIFRIINNSRLYYIEIDRFSQRPVAYGDSYYLDPTVAKGLHPERNVINNEGRVTGWDDMVPHIHTMNSPYQPPYKLDGIYDRHTINLYSQTEYVIECESSAYIDKDNLVYKTIVSTIGEMCVLCGKNGCSCKNSYSYLDLYLAYSAQVLFGDSSPTLVLWMCALKTAEGGAGKSVATLELFSMILGTAATSIDSRTINSGWGDIITSTKILSLEDMPQLGLKEWENVYSNIKQQNTNSYRKVNMKGGAIKSERISIAVTGSTNHRIALSPSDRRFWCLEPAHLHGLTKPLNEEERFELSELLAKNGKDERVQEYVNYLRHIFDEGFAPKIKKALFIAAPHTIYRPNWISGGETNSQNIIHYISKPRELFDICKVDIDDLSNHLKHLFEMVIVAWREDIGKSAVSWKWFEEILPYVQADRNKDNHYSKASISKMLNVDFNTVSKFHWEAWRDVSNLPEGIDPEWATWAAQGYSFSLSFEQAENYKQIIKDMK